MERTAGILSLVAGGIHGGVTPSHFEEWWGYGLFFIFAAAAQIVFGLALLTDAINPKDTGPNWRQWMRWVYWLGVIGNVLIILLYVVTRTVGIPLLGPEAGEVEEVAPIDIVSKVTELAVIGTLAGLLWRGRRLGVDGQPSRAVADPNA